MSPKPLFRWHLPLFDQEDIENRPVRYYAPRRLIILSCSSTKRPDAGRMPARDRYDGPLWQTLRAADPEGRRAQVGFVSARYGFRSAATPIQNYDARLSPQLAAAMIAGGMITRWPRPKRKNGPDNVGMHPGAEIASMRRAASGPFLDVALVGGALYLDVMRAFLAGVQELGHVASDAVVTEINGPIGIMRRDLRAWLASADVLREVRPWGA